MPKKRWSEPQLIILTRGQPEENVLISCKSSSGGPVSCGGTESCGVDYSPS